MTRQSKYSADPRRPLTGDEMAHKKRTDNMGCEVACGSKGQMFYFSLSKYINIKRKRFFPKTAVN